MHFLGAVIGGSNTNEAEGIISPYSEYEEVEEYILYTRDEFLKENRKNDMTLLDAEYRSHPDSKSDTAKELEKRLLLTDEDEALKIYAEECGYDLDEDGNVVSTANEDAFYDWYEFGGRWEELTEGVQGKTCKELSTLYENGDSTVVTLLDDLCVLCDKDGYEGGMFYPVSHMTLWERFEENPDAHVWLVDFHD